MKGYRAIIYRASGEKNLHGNKVDSDLPTVLSSCPYCRAPRWLHIDHGAAATVTSWWRKFHVLCLPRCWHPAPSSAKLTCRVVISRTISSLRPADIELCWPSDEISQVSGSRERGASQTVLVPRCSQPTWIFLLRFRNKVKCPQVRGRKRGSCFCSPSLFRNR